MRVAPGWCLVVLALAGCGARSEMEIARFDAAAPTDAPAPPMDAPAIDAPSPPCTRELRIAFTPTKRLSFAIAIEDAGGTRFATLALTEAVALRGIGNRPGASQMNSGYRWPYGCRTGRAGGSSSAARRSPG